MLVPPDLVDFLESGISIAVGTASADNRPEVVRGLGAQVRPDAGGLTLFVEQSVAARTLDNLQENPNLAVTFSRILDHKTVQLKGTLLRQRTAHADEQGLVEAYVQAFAEQAYIAGLPKHITRRVRRWPCVALEFCVASIFSQTPGPGAGAVMVAERD